VAEPSGRGQVEGGKTIGRSASSTFHLLPYTQAKRQGCKMFKSITLKRVLGAVQRLENAMKKRSAEWALLIQIRVLN